ncbi:MAG: helix-turn-helix transcriptional regulator [Lachnospiraceae bacterium]|nr:helix-turn-helix transcriptional regulator [Lachnospiraceae bacterium]
MSDFHKYLDKQLQNPDFKKEWDNLEPEYNMIQAIIDARKKSNLTQKELAERTGINQADISKLENGNANPTLAVLKRLADGMGMVLKLEFIPKAKS